jgi:hypothetical protein
VSVRAMARRCGHAQHLGRCFGHLVDEWEGSQTGRLSAIRSMHVYGHRARRPANVRRSVTSAGPDVPAVAPETCVPAGLQRCSQTTHAVTPSEVMVPGLYTNTVHDIGGTFPLPGKLSSTYAGAVRGVIVYPPPVA